MRRAATVAVAVLAALAVPGAARGEAKVYKADQFPADIAAAATAVGGLALATQPGWAQGEAFGQMYRPAAGDYPVKIVGLDMILAAPPNAPTLTAPATLEIWLADGDAADPGKAAPDFQISTTDLFNPNTSQLGFPLVGNTAYSVDFDWGSADGHPPLVTQGTIRAMVRYTYASRDLQSEWGTYQCMEQSALGMCGCQGVGALLDQTTTARTNLMHIIWPAGKCTGTKAWKFTDEVGVTGDLILRLRVETGGGCTPACGDRACGDDGCGGSCGTCPDGQQCTEGACVPAGCTPLCRDGSGAVVRQCGDDGCGGSCGACGAGAACREFACVAALSLASIDPAFGTAGESTPVVVTGTGFAAGLLARIAAMNLTGVVVDGDTRFHATVPNLLDPGTYDLSVANPDGSTAVLPGAFQVRAPVPEAADEGAADPGVPDAAQGDEGARDAGADLAGADPGADPGDPSGKKGGGCAAGAGGSPGAWPWLLLALGAVARRGRRWA